MVTTQQLTTTNKTATSKTVNLTTDIIARLTNSSSTAAAKQSRNASLYSKTILPSN